MATQSLSPRRRRLLESATVVVADHGLRGLTHRAVDRQAELPEGSCSSYFRTRRALQTGLAEFLAGHVTRDVERLSASLSRHPGDYERAAASTSKMFLSWLREMERLQALLELSLEATRDPDLAEQVGLVQRQLVGVVDHSFEVTGRGSDPSRAESLIFSAYGILLGALTHPKRERRAYLERSLEILFDSVGPALDV